MKHIVELREIMTLEKIESSDKNFRKFYPEGTPVVNCTSCEDGEKFLNFVDIKDFD